MELRHCSVGALLVSISTNTTSPPPPTATNQSKNGEQTSAHSLYTRLFLKAAGVAANALGMFLSLYRCEEHLVTVSLTPQPWIVTTLFRKCFYSSSGMKKNNWKYFVNSYLVTHSTYDLKLLVIKTYSVKYVIIYRIFNNRSCWTWHISLLFSLQVCCSASWVISFSSRVEPPHRRPGCESLIISSEVPSVPEGIEDINSRSLSPWTWRSVSEWMNEC